MMILFEKYEHAIEYPNVNVLKVWDNSLAVDLKHFQSVLLQ